jgi:hypothetical protein
MTPPVKSSTRPLPIAVTVTRMRSRLPPLLPEGRVRPVPAGPHIDRPSLWKLELGAMSTRSENRDNPHLGRAAGRPQPPPRQRPAEGGGGACPRPFRRPRRGRRAACGGGDHTRLEDRCHATQIAQLPMHLSPRCGAHGRTTGQPCGNGVMPDCRCRMPGGRLLGGPRGDKQALKHGRNSAEAIASRREVAALIGAMRSGLHYRGGKLSEAAWLTPDNGYSRH